jgi:rRNA maturation protein Rpf1
VTYYSLFILSSANTDPEKFNVKDKEELKDVLFNISRRRTEIQRCTEMYSSMKVTADDKAALAEQVRRNTKVIWHLKVPIY